MQEASTKPARQKLVATTVTNLWRAEPSGVYYLFARFRGKLKKKSLKTTTFSTARLLLADAVQSERKAAEVRDPATPSDLTFEQAAANAITQLQAAGKKPRTVQFYKERLTSLYAYWPTLRPMQCSRVTSKACTRWALDYQAKVSAATYNGTLLVLRRVLDTAVDAGLITSNPAKTLKKLKLRPSKPNLPSQEQFEQLLEYLDAIPFTQTVRATKLIRFLAATGCRLSEARNVRWKHVDFVTGVMTIEGDPNTGTKNWETRTIPLFSELRSFLEAEFRDQGVSDSEAPVMHVHEARGTLANACKALKLSRLTHHDLRDMFTTRCIEMGVDIPTIAGWLGHKDGGALLMKTYAHLRLEHSIRMGQQVSFGIYQGTATNDGPNRKTVSSTSRQCPDPQHGVQASN